MKMEKRELIHYGGEGYSYSSEEGKYSVKYDEGGEPKEKVFKLRSKAILFFDSLEGEKALWSQNPMPELLDCYAFNK